MSATDSFQSDVRKDPAELEREADGARASLERTLDALETRLSPSAMLDRVVNTVKTNGGDFSANLLNQVRNNPVPSILAGVGIAWLMTASKRPPPSARSTATSAEDAHPMADGLAAAGDTARESWNGATDKLRGAVAGTRETFAGVSDGTRDAVARFADATRESWHSVADSSRAGARTVGDSFSYLRDEQPLILGALAVAAGALIGGLLPRTQSEDRWLGAASEGAREQIKDTARKAMDAVKGAAGDVASATRGEGRRDGAGHGDAVSQADGEDELDRSVGTQNADLAAAHEEEATGWNDVGKRVDGEDSDPARVAH